MGGVGLTLSQLCACVYVWQLDELSRRTRTQILAATMAAAVGAEVDIPDEAAIRDQFEAALRAEPKQVDPDKQLLLQALGLR